MEISPDPAPSPEFLNQTFGCGCDAIERVGAAVVIYPANDACRIGSVGNIAINHKTIPIVSGDIAKYP